MGRHSTGAVTTGEALRLEINWFLKKGYVKKCNLVSTQISWTSGANIGVVIDFLGEQPVMTLSYYCTHHDKRVEQVTQVINIKGVPSNLGKGLNYYFVCPFTNRMAKVLYCCYGSSHFKSRFAYGRRIYYGQQQSSKLNYHNDRYWELEREIEKLEKQCKRKIYNGKVTKLAIRIQRLSIQRDNFERIRWLMMPKALKKQLGGKPFEI